MLGKLQSNKDRWLTRLLLTIGKHFFTYIVTWNRNGQAGKQPHVIAFSETERDFNIFVREQVDRLDSNERE